MTENNLIAKVNKLLISNFPILFFLFLLIPFYFILYKLYIPRVNAFGCFDDCFNYLGGYFIANGKQIYSDFFFNHQPIPAILSYVIQAITHPINIFDLVLRHRQFLMLFGLLFNSLFIIRFRFVAFLFIPIFELSKFYIFGDRFLAEGLIVYPIVYLFGLVLLRLSKRKLFAIDYLLSAVFTWFIIFSREPYVPLALFLFALIFWGKFRKIKVISICGFAAISALVLLYIFDLKEYFFNVVTFNYTVFFAANTDVSMFGTKYMHVFLYPIYIFFYGEWNIFKQLLVALDVFFVVYLMLLFKTKNYKIVLFVISALGLANLRPTLPAALFYESFHMVVWFAFFVFAVCFLVFKFSSYDRLKFLSIATLSLFLILFVTSKSYFANEKIDQHAEFITNFGEVLQTGEVVKSLSNKDDTLFLDRSDDLIYWQADLPSPYKYVWYTSQMNHFPKYTEERLKMFRNNPPDFYKEFGSCPKKGEIPDAMLPSFVKEHYVRLYNLEKPSCLFVHKEKMKEITPEQWKKAEELLYNLPSIKTSK